MDFRRRGSAVGLVIATLLAGEARAGDADWAERAGLQSNVFEPFAEIRAGVFAHNLIHDENAPVDLSIEALSSPLAFPGRDSPWVAGNPWVSWFFTPRLNLGGMINTGGKTSYGFAGFVWRIPIYGKFFFEGELGGAINNAPQWNEAGRVDMGCVVTFRESGGFGYRFDAHWEMIASVEHISHATFCSKENPGLTQVGVRVGYKF